MNYHPHIPYHLIESFLAVVTEGTLVEAAKKLQLTQPALSKQMNQLENLLPYRVFATVGRKKVLTHYGQSLFDVLSPKFSQTQELIQQTSLTFSRPQDVKIKICGRGELLDLLITHLDFSGQATFSQMSNPAAIESVLNRRSDIGIVHSAIDSSELILKPFLSNSFKLAVPKSLIKDREVKNTQIGQLLKKSPCILYKLDDPVVINSLKEWNLEVSDLKITRIYSNYSSLAKLVELGRGWTILPSHIQLSKANNLIIPIRSKSSFNRKFYLCYRTELKSASWFKDFLNSLKSIDCT